MINFKFITRTYNVSNIHKQLMDNWDDWNMVSRIDTTIIGGDTSPRGFLPLTMGVQLSPEMSIKDSEFQLNTPIYEKYTAVHDFWKEYNISVHARAAFFRLIPGETVGSHIDDGTYYLTKDRYHLAIDGEYEYTVGDETHSIKPGTFFWFDNKILHESKNVSKVNRITLVFDLPHSACNPHHFVVN